MKPVATPTFSPAQPDEATRAAVLAAVAALPPDDPRWQHLADVLLPPPSDDEIWARHRPIVEARMKAWDARQTLSLEEVQQHMAQRKAAPANANSL